MVKIIIIQLRGWGGGSIDETRVVEYLIVEVVGKSGLSILFCLSKFEIPPRKKNSLKKYNKQRSSKGFHGTKKKFSLSEWRVSFPLFHLIGIFPDRAD